METRGEDRMAPAVQGAEAAGPAPAPARPQRMLPEERRRALIEKATDYFSEAGFEGGTRELAKRMGITQPLIYRYFPSKDDLVNEVYRAVYLEKWKEDWAGGLCRREVPLGDRLLAFYADYTATVFERRWMRIFFFAGLRGLDINTRYIERVRAQLLVPICLEARASFGFEAHAPVTDAEMALVWVMHGAIFYHGVRAMIYNLPDRTDPGHTARLAVSAYLAEAPRTIAAALAAPAGG